MKYLNQQIFIGLFCILCILDISFCTDGIYEEISPYVQNSKIIDPNSLYYNRQTQTISIPKNFDDADSESKKIMLRNADTHQLYCKDSHYEVFARRLINMLVLKSNFKIIDGIASGKLDLEATVDELEMIKGFGEGKNSIRQIDSVISNVIRPIQTSLFDEMLSYTDILRFYIYEYRIIFGTILLIIFVIIISFKIKWTRFRVIILIFDILFVISYVMTWWELVQENVIETTAKEKIYSLSPSICGQKEIDFFSKVKFLFGQYTGFGKETCVQYFQLHMSDPVLKVSPFDILNQMISKFLFSPITIAAQYLSRSIDIYTGSLEWPLYFIIKPLLYITTPILLILIIINFIFGSPPLLHLFVKGKESRVQSSLLDRSNRQAIEIINSDTSKDDITCVKEKKSNQISEKPKEILGRSNKLSKEKEFEKIFEKRDEIEINEISNVEKVEKEYLEQQKTSDLKTKNKMSSEIGDGDN